jgi:hypothetical protein
MAQEVWTAAKKQAWVDKQLRGIKNPVARARFMKRMEDEGVIAQIQEQQGVEAQDRQVKEHLAKPGVPEFQSYEDILKGYQEEGAAAESDAYKKYMGVRSSVRNIQKDAKGFYYIDPTQEMQVPDPATSVVASKWVPARVDLSEEEAIQMKAENKMRTEQMNRHQANYRAAVKSRKAGEKKSGEKGKGPSGYEAEAQKEFARIVQTRDAGTYKEEPFADFDSPPETTSTDSPASVQPAKFEAPGPGQMRKNVANTIMLARQGDNAPAWDDINKDRLEAIEREREHLAATKRPPDPTATSDQISAKKDKPVDKPVDKVVKKPVKKAVDKPVDEPVKKAGATSPAKTVTAIKEGTKKTWNRFVKQWTTTKAKQDAKKSEGKKPSKDKSSSKKKTTSKASKDIQKVAKSSFIQTLKENQMKAAAERERKAAERKRKAEARKNK